MSFVFNPLTGKLDIKGASSGGSPPALPPVPYMRVPRRILVLGDSRFRIDVGGAVQVFSPATSSSMGFRVLGKISVRAGSSLDIEAASNGTVLGV